MAYPFKNNLNISYQEAMANDARSKAMGDYDAINVDSEELIDYTPSFQEQYNADMAKVASNNERIKELEAIIAQKKQDEVSFAKYRNNPLYKAAKFDYVVTGNRSGLDQFLADERAREEMIRQSKEAELNRQNAEKLAKLNKQGMDEANEIERDKMKNLSVNRVKNAKEILNTDDTAQNRAKLSEAIIEHNANADKYGWVKFDEQGNIISQNVNTEGNQGDSKQDEPKYTTGDAEADLAKCSTSAECMAIANKLESFGDEYKNIRTKAITKAQELKKKEDADAKRKADKVAATEAINQIISNYTTEWKAATNNDNKAKSIIRKANKALKEAGYKGTIDVNAEGTGLVYIKGK